MLIEVKTVGNVRKFLVDNNCSLEGLGDMEQREWCLAEQEATSREAGRARPMSESEAGRGAIQVRR